MSGARDDSRRDSAACEASKLRESEDEARWVMR